jgi:GntR family transcriptional regulator/MocR family aminotransferase
VDVDAGMALAPDARVVCVSPSHQYPLGRTLSLSRRHRLLDWVNIADAWIVEDDYDCEYRYQGRPLVSLQGLDTHDRVIYIGTFSKILFPGLRIGYMVVPPDLAQPFTNARAAMDKYVHIVNQIVLHEFMAEGYFSRHIRQMRAVYDERRQLCLDALAAELDGRLELGPSEAGMHVCGHMPPTISDRAVARCAEQRGIEVLPLSEFYLGETPHNGLILGYTGIQPERIRGGVEKLAQAIEDASTIF